ncbi:hypothetical protein ACPPVW_06345 [Leifsonia sp. McL0607]|uniref:hypothetical protein n=1 Tax=Leifsonia sp. McL0607 TaxID=3415672 RepID=UPI003CEA8150
MILDEVGDAALAGVPESFIGAVVTGAALAIGDDDLRYTGASVQRTEELVRLRFGGFTDSTLTTISADFDLASRHAEVVTRVHRRSDLERLEIRGGTASFGGDDPAEWPGSFAVRAQYRDGLEIVIPMSDANTPKKRNAVWTILAGLRQDLSTR